MGKSLKRWSSQAVVIAFEIHRPEKLDWVEMFQNVKAQGYSRFITESGIFHRVDDDNAIKALSTKRTRSPSLSKTGCV